MQNTKKWLIIMVAVAFGITVIASCFMLFSVKKVNAEFSVFGDSEAYAIQKDLEDYKGKSLIFLGTADVYALSEKYPHYEFISVEKKFPNVLNVKIAKRTEVFKVVTSEKTYILDGAGYIINDTGDTEYSRSVVPITMGDITVQDGTVGKKIVTSDDGIFYSVIETAQSLNLNDVVKEINIIVNTRWVRDAIFVSYSGVKVEIWDVEDDGTEKIKQAFAKYENLSDYRKSSNKIIVHKVDGVIKVD